MSKLKNIIFDLGAVLLDIDYDKTARAFHQLGYTNFEEMYSKFKGNNIFNDFETGHISNPEFYKYMLEAGNGLITEMDIRNAWNSMLLDFRVGSIRYLPELSQRFRIFLLSNTNAVHQVAFENKFLAQIGSRPLREYFTQAYFSHEIGFRKPDAAIFEFVLADAAIAAEETLFVDDIPANTEVARGLVFHIHTLLPGERIENLDYDLISS